MNWSNLWSSLADLHRHNILLLFARECFVVHSRSCRCQHKGLTNRYGHLFPPRLYRPMTWHSAHEPSEVPRCPFYLFESFPTRSPFRRSPGGPCSSNVCITQSICSLSWPLLLLWRVLVASPRPPDCHVSDNMLISKQTYYCSSPRVVNPMEASYRFGEVHSNVHRCWPDADRYTFAGRVQPLS